MGELVQAQRFAALLIGAIAVLTGCTAAGEADSGDGTREPAAAPQPTISLFIRPPTSTPGPSPTPLAVRATAAPTAPVGTPGPASLSANGDGRYILFNQRIIEGLSTRDLDVQNVDQVFKYVFSQLPGEVTVYPSENYYYFVFYAEDRQFWGNIRLPARSRADGDLSFAYFEFDEFPLGQRTGLTRAKFYNSPDGVFVREKSRFVWEVEFEGKSVIFNLHELRQDRPRSFALDQDETFIQRTFDESGLQFFLLFNRTHNNLYWVLNEEEIVPDTLIEVEGQPDFLIAKKSGFLFWVEREHSNRKILAAIRGMSVRRNDYYDGPFDQLADNYAAETNVSEFMQRAFPGLRGRIDMFGYYLDQEDPLRVAISTYYAYQGQSDLDDYFVHFDEAVNKIDFISHGTLPDLVEPTATAESGAQDGEAVPSPAAAE